MYTGAKVSLYYEVFLHLMWKETEMKLIFLHGNLDMVSSKRLYDFLEAGIGSVGGAMEQCIYFVQLGQILVVPRKRGKIANNWRGDLRMGKCSLSLSPPPHPTPPNPWHRWPLFNVLLFSKVDFHHWLHGMGFKLTVLIPINAIFPVKLDVNDEFCHFLPYHLEP